MSMEIIKQLYDIGNLFDVVTDSQIIKNSFFRFAKTELAYRNITGMSEADVLEDIYQTSLCIVTRGQGGKGNFEELQKGIQRISGFTFQKIIILKKRLSTPQKQLTFQLLIKHNANTIEKFKNPSQIKDWLIVESPNNKLNKLKKTNHEAFFYWYKIHEMHL